MKSKCLLLPIFAIVTHAVTAETFTWTGLGSSGNWSDGGNWVGGSAPTNDGTADIEIQVASLPWPNADVPWSVHSLKALPNSARIEGADITLGAGGITNSLSIATFQNFEISNNLTFSANQPWNGDGRGTIIYGNVNNAGFDLEVITGSNSIQGVLSGSGSVLVNGGSLNLQNNNSYSGTTIVRSGQLGVSGQSALGTSTSIVNFGDAGTASDADLTLSLHGSINRAIAFNGQNGEGMSRITHNGTHSLSGSLSVTNELVLESPTAPFGLLINSTISDGAGVGSLRKTGAGIVALTGNNSFTGAVAVEEGTLLLSSSGNSISGGSLMVGNGATVEWLNYSNMVNDAAGVTLAGGTITISDFYSSTFTETMGDMTVSLDSVIDFGESLQAKAFSFGNSSALDWNENLLTILGFNPNTDTLRFGTDANGLSPHQLSLFRFADYGDVAGRIDNFGYVTPIPEPSGLLLSLLGTAFLLRRRI